MGADIKRLQSRIKSVDSTLHLTKAMGLVASSKMRRATKHMLKSHDYAEEISNIVSLVGSAPECKKSPYVVKHGEEKITLIAIAGDRGLAGGYNANVFRFVRDNCTYNDVIAIGKRACERYGKAFQSSEEFFWADAIRIATEVCEAYKRGEIDKLGIVSTKYVSMMTQEPQLTWLLPLERSNQENVSSILFEQDKVEILDTIVPEYIAGVLMAAVRESFASEIAARRMAMDAAEKNGREMIDQLKLKYNRARQSAITQEITEIIAGSGT